MRIIFSNYPSIKFKALQFKCISLYRIGTQILDFLLLMANNNLQLPIAYLQKLGKFASIKDAYFCYITASSRFGKTTFLVNNNTPLRLTSVAHLGGFSF